MRDDVVHWDGFLPYLRLGDDLSIPTYYLIISLGSCLCVYYARSRAERKNLRTTFALDLAMILLISGFIGGRLLHIVFENPEVYLRDPWQVFRIWEGGFVWYGGMILALISCTAWMKWRKWPLGIWFDVFAPVVSLGYVIGRIACFFTGCCFGDVCYLFEGLTFRHPTQSYAFVFEAAWLFFLLRWERKVPSPRFLKIPGSLFAVWLIGHGIGRLFMESLRADFRGAELFGMSLSTWLSFVAISMASFWLWQKYSHSTHSRSTQELA